MNFRTVENGNFTSSYTNGYCIRIECAGIVRISQVVSVSACKMCEVEKMEYCFAVYNTKYEY